MRQRLISAAVLVPVVVIVFLAGQPWLTLGIALLAALAAYETAQLVRRAGLRASIWPGLVAAPAIVVLFPQLLGPGGIEHGWVLVAPAIALLFITAAALSFGHRDQGTAFQAWAGTVLATIYPSLLAFAAGLLTYGQAFGPSAPAFSDSLDIGRLWLLVLVLTVWSYDSFAYLAGRYHGRGRFMNHISPNKTWSGVIGGTVAAVGVCGALVGAIGPHPLAGALLGLLIAAAAQAGDLAESMLKRAAGAKDSGTFIPGHGGILDRIDSFLFAAPAMYGALVVAGLLEAGGLL